jgi:hypothetical protein
MRFSARWPTLVQSEMNTTDPTLTNGRYELPAHARGVLVLADPPEAGWRLELPPDEEVEPEAEQAAGTQAISRTGGCTRSRELGPKRLRRSVGGRRP